MGLGHVLDEVHQVFHEGAAIGQLGRDLHLAKGGVGAAVGLVEGGDGLIFLLQHRLEGGECVLGDV